MYIDVAQFVENPLDFIRGVVNDYFMGNFDRKSHMKEYRKMYLAKNRDKIKEYRHKYYLQNKEKIKKNKLDYYHQNRDRQMANHNKYLNDHPLRRTYDNMISRCYCKTNPAYCRYGGRGITVCDRWLGKDGFINFENDMSCKPNGYSLDRIDNDMGYSPENCRWTTPLQQGNNKRNNIIIDGFTVAEWSRKLNIPYGTLYSRYKRHGSIERM